MRAKVTENWIPPREWTDCGTAFILGGGPSICDLGHDKLLAKLDGRYPVIATNSSFLLYPQAEVLFAADEKWWQDSQWSLDRHVGWWKVWRASSPGRTMSPRPQYPLRIIRGEHEGGLSLDPSFIRGRNSGHMALNLAVHFGAPRIVLVGFDMHRTGKQHFHNLHTRQASVDSYATWMADFAKAVPTLAKAGVTVLNANPGSGLRCFPFCNLEDCI